MKFKQVEWEKRQNGYFVANVAFGLQLTVDRASDKWIWEIGNLSFVFKHGKSNSEFMAKENAEHHFQPNAVGAQRAGRLLKREP